MDAQLVIVTLVLCFWQILISNSHVKIQRLDKSDNNNIICVSIF